MKGKLHGVVAGFASPESFIDALRRVRRAGYSAVEVNVPFAVEGMDEYLAEKPTPIASAVLVAGIVGAAGGYFLQWFAARDYPVNVGGRPLNSWPAFIPVTFETTVLAAALAGVAALLWLCRLPQFDHPLFAVPGFQRASQDRYFVGIRATDPRFDVAHVRALLDSLSPETVAEVRS